MTARERFDRALALTEKETIADFCAGTEIRAGTLVQQLARDSITSRMAVMLRSRFLRLGVTVSVGHLMLGEEPGPTRDVTRKDAKDDTTHTTAVAKILPEATLQDVRSGLPLFAPASAPDGTTMILPRRGTARIRWPDALIGVGEAFAVYVLDGTMEPRLRPGEVVVLHPNRPPRVGDDCLFLADHEGGQRRAVFRQLVGMTERKWKVLQLHPRNEYDLPRTDWRAHPIVEIRLPGL